KHVRSHRTFRTDSSYSSHGTEGPAARLTTPPPAIRSSVRSKKPTSCPMLPLILPLLLTADPETPPPIAVVALDRKDAVSYEKEIVPILEAKCLACHSGNVRRNGYDMATHEGLL